MPTICGRRVRELAADRGLSVPELAKKAGIPDGTMRNATRDNGQVISLPRIFAIARVLAGGQKATHAKVSEVAAYIRDDNDGVPSKPPEQPKPKPKPEPRRDGTKGPKRDRAVA